jgi:putative peptidoglycan lipid II flippase
MWRAIFERLQRSLFGGALIVSASWIVSKFLGLVKQRLILTHFGPSGADPVFAAFAIPDLIYGTLILGSLLTAFMPVFIELRQKGQQDEAWKLSRAVLKALTVTFIGFGLVLLIFANQIVPLLVGRNYDPANQQTIAFLLRVLSMNMLFFATANVFAGMLQAYKQFVAVSAAPLVYNISIILGIEFLSPRFGVTGVAYGAVIGAFLHLVIHAAAAWRIGWRPGPSLSWGHADVRKVWSLLFPRTVGQSVTQIDQFVNVPIATRLGPGQLAIFRSANDIQDAPINIIGLSMATVAFPVFIELLNQGKKEEFIAHFSRIVRQILFLIIPLTVLIIQLRAQIVRLFFGAPNITWDVTIATAQTLGFFAVSFFAQSLVPVLARSFYAMKDTKTPVRITMFAVGLDILGSIILGKYMGVQGLALSYTISNVLNATLLFIVLHRRLGNLDENRIAASILRIIGVTMVMGIAVQITKQATVALGFTLTRAYGVLAQAVAATVVAILTYAIFSVLFKLDEASLLVRAANKMGLRRSGGTV